MSEAPPPGPQITVISDPAEVEAMGEEGRNKRGQGRADLFCLFLGRPDLFIIFFIFFFRQG